MKVYVGHVDGSGAGVGNGLGVDVVEHGQRGVELAVVDVGLAQIVARISKALPTNIINWSD
jgi:hypothetical protein